RKDAAGHAQIAQAEGDGRFRRVLQEHQQTQVVGRLQGGDGDLDDVGVRGAHLRVDLFQVVGNAAKVVIADDALGVLVAAQVVDDVELEIHPIEAGDDRL